MSSKSDNFFEQVYQVVRQIPYGKVCTYGIIAELLGSKGSSRMVGWAMNNGHKQVPSVPAHRVVNRNGLLTGKMHFQSPDLMQQLLEKEGLIVKDDKILNFKENLWNPLLG